MVEMKRLVVDFLVFLFLIGVLVGSNYVIDPLLMSLKSASEWLASAFVVVAVAASIVHSVLVLWHIDGPLAGQHMYMYNRLTSAALELLFYCALLCDPLTTDVAIAFAFTMFVSAVHFLLDLHLEEWFVRPNNVPETRRLRIFCLFSTCVVIDWLLTLRPEYIAGIANDPLRQIMQYEYLNLFSIIITNILKHQSPYLDMHQRPDWFLHTVATLRRSLLVDAATLVLHSSYYLYLLWLNPLTGLLVGRVYRMSRRFWNTLQQRELLWLCTVSRWGMLHPPSAKRRARVGLLCSICQEPLYVRRDAKMLPCGHVYHGGCLFPWLERIQRCPYCCRPTVHVTDTLTPLPYDTLFPIPNDLLLEACGNEGRLMDRPLKWHLFQVRYGSDFFAYDGDYLYVQMVRNYGVLVLGGFLGQPLRKSAIKVHYIDLVYLADWFEARLVPAMHPRLKRFLGGVYDELGFNGLKRVTNALLEEFNEEESDDEEWYDAEENDNDAEDEIPVVFQEEEDEEEDVRVVEEEEWDSEEEYDEEEGLVPQIEEFDSESDDDEDHGFHDGTSSDEDELRIAHPIAFINAPRHLFINGARFEH